MKTKQGKEGDMIYTIKSPRVLSKFERDEIKRQINVLQQPLNYKTRFNIIWKFHVDSTIDRIHKECCIVFFK